MIVYVESNFVLELAFLQEEHHSASMILEHAVSRRIHLRMLAYCGGEPYERMVRRAKDRKTLQDRLAQEIRDLSRSQPYVDIGDLSRALTVILAKSADEEKDRLDASLSRITAVAEIIALDGAILRNSVNLQTSLGLSPQDAIVFASVNADLEVSPATEEKLLITRNSKDFLTPSIEDILNRYGCKLLTRFSDGIGYIDSIINPPSGLSAP